MTVEVEPELAVVYELVMSDGGEVAPPGASEARGGDLLETETG
jgi:hypothetical protein